MSCWIPIEALRPHRFGHAVIGPFDDPVHADRHLADSGQVDGMCEDDALDAWTGGDTDKAATTTAWDSAGEPWWLYVAPSRRAPPRCPPPSAPPSTAPTGPVMTKSRRATGETHGGKNLV